MNKDWFLSPSKKIKNKIIDQLKTKTLTPFPTNEKRLNIALCGLGNYAVLIAEGIQQSNYCRLSGIITGSKSKTRKWKEKFNIPDQNCYCYDNFDEIISNQNIDLIYILLPTDKHEEFVIRAAEAKKHVITEKPMATSSEACMRMIEACKRNQVQLAVGYRLRFEPYHLEIKRLGQEKIYGKIKTIEASIGYDIKSKKKNWRNDQPNVGGGPLFDLGIYCIQACRYVIGSEPINIEVISFSSKSITWKMEFPGKISTTCSCSFEKNIDHFLAVAENGTFELSPAFGYGPFKGRSSEKEFDFPITNQQQMQMDALAKVILSDEKLPRHITGNEGLKDIKIIQAVYQSIALKQKVIL